MMKKLTIFCLVGLLLGCEKDDTNTNDQNPDEAAANVVVISDESSNLVSSTQQLANGIYIFEFNTPVPEIVANDIVVGDEDQGFLRSVSAVTIDNNTLTLQTSQATMDDLFNDATVAFSTDISERGQGLNIGKDLKINYIHDGVRLMEDGFTYDFSNTILYEDPGLQFKISEGMASFNPNFNFDADYSLFTGLDYLKFKADNASLTIDSTLELIVSGEHSIPEFSTTLIDYDKRFTFPVGGIPVVVVVSTILDAELSASIESSVTASADWTNSYVLNTGVTYENDAWSANFNLDSSLVLNEINFNGQVNLTQNLTITPRVSVKFYGIAGPYCEPKMTEDFEFNASTDLNWDTEFKVGLDLTTGIDVTIFGRTVADFARTDNFEEIIYNAPAALEIVSGNNQTGNPGQQLPEPIKVKVTDSQNNPLPNVLVHFIVSPNSGFVDNTTLLTNANGFAETYWTLVDNDDTQTVEVSVVKADGTNINGSPLTFSASGVGGNGDLFDYLTGNHIWQFDGYFSAIIICYDEQGNVQSTSQNDLLDWLETLNFHPDGTITDTGNCEENGTFSLSGNNLSFTFNVICPVTGQNSNTTKEFNGIYNESQNRFIGSAVLNGFFYYPNGDVSCEFIGTTVTINLF